MSVLSEFKKDDPVVVKDRDIRGRVVSQTKHRVRVETRFGLIDVRDSELRACDPRQLPTTMPGGVRVHDAIAVDDTLADSIDLHGMTTEDAVAALDRFLDRAALAGKRSITIVHGKGSGKLTAAVHHRLSGLKNIKSFGFADSRRGSYGATVVELS